MVQLLAYSLVFALCLLMILFTIMKWILFRNTGLKEFTLKYLFWGHSEIFPLFSKIISQKNPEERTSYYTVYYGAIISFYYALASGIILIIVNLLH